MNILKKCIITIITISLIFVFFKYKNKDITENSIDSVLKDAHENRSELEFVLTYFKDDSIKYNAAKFLIQNMSRHFSITSPELDEIKEIKYNKWHLNDSDKTKYANFNYNKLPKSYDLKEIKASLLINNINLAVDVWMSRPWHNKYSFDEFCEYVLPYRVGDEPLEDWRALYYNRYACILDSLYKGKDPVEAAEKIMTYIKQEGFDNYTDIKLPHLGASFLYKQRAGYCRENCDIALYVLRSLGIPVAMDFYESSPSYNSRHFWTAIIDTCHPRKSIAFNYTEDPINRDRATGSRRKGKVYRHYYSNQTKLADYTFTNNVPSFFKRQDIADVTHEYFGHNSILINNHCIFKNPFIYLSIFNGNTFDPIDISHVYTYQFNNIEPEVIYFPTQYNQGKMIAIDYPFLIDKNRIHRFVPSYMRKVSAKIIRKYPIRNNLQFLSTMVGSTIEISKFKDFTKTDTLKNFDKPMTTNTLLINCKKSTELRYLRYSAKENKRIELGELRFYNNGQEIFPDTIWANHRLGIIHRKNLKLISDDDWSSFYMADRNGEKLIFDFGKNIYLDSILFIPRNDDNFIHIGDNYELFYHTGAKGWKSLGKQKANSNILYYDNIPNNSILWLHNHTRGKEERCFYLLNGQQVFI